MPKGRKVHVVRDGVCAHCGPGTSRVKNGRILCGNSSIFYSAQKRRHLKMALKPEFCPICQVNPPTDADHDHTTGGVRDWLCHSCNVGLGMFQDDPALMRAAALYIERHEPI